jgi:hypothetical protein
MAARAFELTGVAFVKRIVVGTNNPAEPQNDAKIEEALALLNRCLTDSPRGRILGIEKSFTILQLGEHNVVLQWLTYHIGFERKPFWLAEQG